MNSLLSHFPRGIALARNNPQIIYAIFLMIAIPLAFFASGQRFLDASNENQERLERERIGLMQDVFVSFAPEKMNDPEFLNRTIAHIKAQKGNEDIKEFIVTKLENNDIVIIASLNPDDIGKIVDEVNKNLYTDLGSAMKTGSVSFYGTVGEERHLRGYRAIVDNSGTTLGFFLVDVSMQRIDALAAQSVWNAYIFLAFIVLAILALLVRQTRIVDYTVLYRRLQEVDQMKDDFVSMAAHELRTPLTVIRGYIDLLHGVENLEEKDREKLRRIDVSAQRLNALIGDILDVSRLEQGRMKFEFSDVDLNEAASTLVESFQMMAKEKGLELSFAGGENIPKISADSERLRQVLTNIIGNAIKYTPSGSVTVKVFSDPIRKKVFLRASDTGLGISAEDQKRLFEKFFRIKSDETSKIQGTGLGLWITREIVLSMKGEISVESIKGKGTDFVISFPSLEGNLRSSLPERKE